jgi:hypothetical protein
MIELFLQFCEADPNQNNCSKLQYAEYDGFFVHKNTGLKNSVLQKIIYFSSL